MGCYDNVAIKRNKEVKFRQKYEVKCIMPKIKKLVDSAAMWITLRVNHIAWTTRRVVHTLHNTTAILTRKERKNSYCGWGKIIVVGGE